MRPRLLAPSLITLGSLLALTTALLPGEARWTHTDQARQEHVTTLGRDGGGQLHAGTQSGRLWHLEDEQTWRDIGGTLGASAITVLAPDRDDGLLVGTSDGLYRWRGAWERLLASGRISDVRILDADTGGLLVTTGNRVLERQDGSWRDADVGDVIGDTPVYRALTQATAEGQALHAGTIGRGVWTRLPGTRSWQHNNAALPADAKVFALALADNGLLLAGTDQGLYWQPAPATPWRHVDSGLGTRRVLDLAMLERPAGTLLLAASDDGVRSIRLIQRQRSLETQGRWQLIPAEPAGLDRPVSWIVPGTETVWISAGSVYRLARARSGLWYAGLAAGGTMAFAGLYMIVAGRRRYRGHASV